jgi:HEPN domain-containing protein
MTHKESLYPDDWMHIAEKDLKRADRLLVDNDVELAGFCLQQALEKFLKSYLLSRGWQLRRIHNLDALLDDAVTYDESLEEFRSVCQKVSGFYFVERYPFVVEAGITKEDVYTSLEKVKKLVKKLRAEIARNR